MNEVVRQATKRSTNPQSGIQEVASNFIGKVVRSDEALVVHPLPTPMTKVRFDNGITVTIRDGWVQTPSPTLIAILDTLAATLPGYGRIPSFSMRISTLRRDSPRMAGADKIVRRDKMPLLPADVTI